jgi:hypothetical protein
VIQHVAKPGNSSGIRADILKGAGHLLPGARLALRHFYASEQLEAGETREVPKVPPHPFRPASPQGREDAAAPPSQMSRKRPASAVTCHDEGELVADLREWSFGCFTLVPVGEAGSPRKVPEDFHG